MGDLVGLQIKISWKMQKRDGAECFMHIAGVCTNQTETELSVQGNDGDVFTIPIRDIVKLRRKPLEV